jgi:putative tricarboxylic transport membrane protein
MVLRTKRTGNIASGAFLALLGVVAAWASTDIGEGAGGNLHPRTFPLLIGICLFLGGAGLAVSSYLSKDAADKPIDWPDRSGWKFWITALASLIVYVGLSDPLGFLICTFLFVAGFIWHFGRYSPVVAVAWALGVVGFVYFVFVRLLDMTLPLGPLSFLA